MRSKLILLGCFALCAALGAKANTGTSDCTEPSKKSDILGGVYHHDTKKPLSNVVVTAFSGNKKEKTVLTDSNGNYSFDELKPGTYTFVFQKDGFKKVTKAGTIHREDEGLQLNVSLQEHNTFDFMPGPSIFFDSGE